MVPPHTFLKDCVWKPHSAFLSEGVRVVLHESQAPCPSTGALGRSSLCSCRVGTPALNRAPAPVFCFPCPVLLPRTVTLCPAVSHTRTPQPVWSQRRSAGLVACLLFLLASSRVSHCEFPGHCLLLTVVLICVTSTECPMITYKQRSRCQNCCGPHCHPGKAV